MSDRTNEPPHHAGSPRDDGSADRKIVPFERRSPVTPQRPNNLPPRPPRPPRPPEPPSAA